MTPAPVWLSDLLTAWLARPGLYRASNGRLQVMRALDMSIDPTAPCHGRAALRRCAVR